MSDREEEWYYDLKRRTAVPASERGHSDDLLGPYPSKAAAENWRNTVAARNEAWEAEDDRWEHLGEKRDQ